MKKISKELEDYIFQSHKLKSVRDLVVLDLYKDIKLKIIDLDGFDSFEKLILLRLDCKYLENITGIKNSKLVSLSLFNINSKCDINDIRSLHKLEDLRIIKSTFNPDILNYLPYNIERLELTECNISDLNFLKRMPYLKYLDLTNNNISDISALSDLKNIRNINLFNNPFKEDDLYHLKDLDLLTLSYRSDDKWILLGVDEFKNKMKHIIRKHRINNLLK